MTPFGLGGKPRPYDKRDYQIDSFGSVSPTPASYQSPIPTTYMQTHKPACGSHAGALSIDMWFNSSIVSPEMGWKEIKLIDGFPPEDGTTMDAIFKEMKDTSYCSLSLMPNDTNDSISLAEYTDPSTITPEMVSDASSKKIVNYAFTNKPTLQQIKDAVYQHRAVILLVDVFDTWWIPSWSEKDILPLRTNGSFAGHHFICVTGFDEKYIYFQNSWSTLWGRQGTGYFDASYIPHILEMGIATLPSSPTTPQYKFTTFMMYGMTSADVHALQVKLGVNPTGFFGVATIMAVAAFQKAHGLFPSAFVGPATLAFLNA